MENEVANAVVAQLLHLDSEDHKRDISMYIYSPGDSIPAMLAMYDTMRFVQVDLETIAMGTAASAGAVPAGDGEKGIVGSPAQHGDTPTQPAVQGLGGQATYVEVHARDLPNTKRRINHIMAEAVGSAAAS